MLLLAASSRGAPPDTQTNVYQENVGVSLIEVPATVLDSSGRPVRDLQAADFQVFDDGREVKLESLDVNEFISAATAAAVTHAAVQPAARRRFLLLFDLSFVTSAELVRARDAARHFVNEEMGAADLAAVATLSTKKGAEIIVQFTDNRAALAKSIGEFPVPNTFHKPASTISGSDDASGKGAFSGSEISWFQKFAHQQDADRMDVIIRGLGAIADALGPVGGRKQILYFSHGFDVMADDTRLLIPLNKILERLRRDDCILHTVDLGGIQAKEDRASNEDWGNTNNEVLADMAKETGGEFLTNSNNFASQLGRVLEATSVVYLMSFHPVLTGHPGQYHRLEVRCARRGVRLSARPGYYEPKGLS